MLSCDQSGSKRFQDFRDHSVYAAGVAINNQGELYFGNGLAGGAGMQITKYSATGVVLWTNVYPQGDYIYRLALDSQGNVIATGPDYSGYYANWITMKVSPAGALVWSATYDALTANNEVPAYVALDPLDNVYVTGVGGPEVVAANGSRYMRMVTVKYSAGGALVWTIGSIEGGSGNVVRVGGDGSTLFVQGYGGMYTARYRQTGLAGDVPPPPPPPPVVAPAAPTNLAASSSARARINLTWTNTATNATSITVQRCSGSTCTAFVAVAQLAATANVLDRLRGEVALDLSLSDVRVQRCGEVAVLEHRERDGALSTEPRPVRNLRVACQPKLAPCGSASKRRLVNQAGASWNQLFSWLREIDRLRRIA